MYGKILLILLIGGACSWLFLISANELANRNIIPKSQLQKAKLDQVTWQNSFWQFKQLIVKAPKINQQTANLTQIWQQAGPQLTTLKNRSLNVAETSKKFVQTLLFSAQTSISASSSDPTKQSGPTQAPLEQRTIEYAKYLYCKETVKAYEELNPGLLQK